MDKDILGFKMNGLLEILLEEDFDIIGKTKPYLPQQCEFPISEDVIKVAIGMRRTDKTYFLYQTTRNLLKQGQAPLV